MVNMSQNMRHQGLTTCLLLGVVIAAPVRGAAPAWLDDPANSRWLVFGAAGILESNGVSLRDGTSEGDLTPAVRGGVACGQSVRSNGRPGYFYLISEPWEALSAWLGDSDVLLTARYYDGAAGRMVIKYDSSDPRVKLDPYPAGVWRRPDAYPKGVQLEGSRTWKTLATRLPYAFLTKRVHGADLRIEGNAADFALAGVALTRVPKGDLADLLVKQELRVARARGFSAGERIARFVGTFVQQGDAPILLEAELATSLSLQDGNVPRADRGASGGAYIHYVESASWQLTLATPGRYIAWERAYFPWKGGWNHTEGVDGNESIVDDGVRIPEEGWQWIEAGAYDLTSGEHTFSLTYHGGARLDAIVLSRADTAPDLEALSSAYRGPTTGEVWTTPVKPFDLAQWRSVRFSFGGVPGAATYEYSTNGTDWTPFDPAEDLAAITTVGSGRDSLQFHLTVEAAAPVLFAGGTLSYLAGPNNVKAVENVRLRLEMDPYGVRSLLDKKAGKVVSRAAQVHDALAMVVTKKPGASPTASADLYNSLLEEVEIGGTAETPVLTMGHRLANGMRLTTNATLRPDGQTEWQLTIENPTALEVAEVRFPVLTGVKLGGDAADDWMFEAKCWGQVWKNPAGHRLRVDWGPSMRWMALWDGVQGLYYGIEDPRLDDYAFVFGGDSSGGATLAAAQRILCKPRSTWTSGIYRVALTGPDWHEGADLYRAYVAEVLERPEPPAYVKWLVDGWITQDSNRANTAGWDMITPDVGSPLMAANRQMTDGADSGYCGLYPYPAAAWGSTQEFAQKLAIRRALGGMYTPYHNFHLWSPGYGHFPRIGSYAKTRLPREAPVPNDAWYARVATHAYNGSYPRVERDRFAQLGMAMGSEEWRDWLAHWTDAYLGWGADGMYYDQFNMIYPNGKLYPDFPDTYGCWTRATLDIIARLRAASRARNPYYTASGEVCNDVYGQYVDLHMTSGVFNRLEFYRYCNPGQLLIDGGWNGGTAGAFGGQERYRFIWQVGARFEQFPPDKRLVALRRAVKSLLYDAQFMDTVGLTVTAGGKALTPDYTYAGRHQNAPFRGTIGRWFRYRKDRQRGAVVNLINAPVRKDAVVTLDVREVGPITAAYAWTLEGRLLPVRGEQREDNYTFPVPASECSSVVLANALAPVVRWEIDPAITQGATRTLELALTNVTAAPLSGSATLRLPSGWPPPAPVAFGPIAGGDTLTFALRVVAPAEAEAGRCDVWCDLATPSGDVSTYSFVVVNPPVLVDFRGNPGSYHLWFRNLSDAPVGGAIEVAAPAPLALDAAAKVAIPPRGEFSLPVTVNGQAQLTEIAEMSARVTLDGRRQTLVRAVIPAVPNGTFERDSAGDRKPDWWMCRKVRDRWAYDRMHLAEGAHSGEYCLQLDPPRDDEGLSCAYPVHSVVKPNTRYRVSVWIKAASGSGVYANLLGRHLGKGQTGPQWRRFTAETTTGSGTTGLYRTLYNSSTSPAYFDDLVIEELR